MITPSPALIAAIAYSNTGSPPEPPEDDSTPLWVKVAIVAVAVVCTLALLS